MTPTQKSLAYLKENGYTTAVVERWNPFAKIRQDLFGFIDIIAIRPSRIQAIQTTSSENLKARIKKIIGLKEAVLVSSSGCDIIVHGWGKTKHKSKQFRCYKLLPIIANEDSSKWEICSLTDPNDIEYVDHFYNKEG